MFKNYFKTAFRNLKRNKNYAIINTVGLATIFIVAMVSSIVIAWITVAHRAIKAAIENPVKSLRTE